MTWKDISKGILFGALLYLTSFFGSIVFLTPIIPIFIVWPCVGRHLSDIFLWLWYILAVALFELLLGVKIVIHGSPAPPLGSTLILCNHRTRLEWLFLMSYQLRCASLKDFRISLKAPLKKIPGPGWAMQTAGFLFLDRVWNQDKYRITQAMRYFARCYTRPQFLLFPEGIDFCARGLAKSKSFAEKNGFPMYEYVLHPRTTGFIHFVNEMRKNNILNFVVDVTVAYPKNIVHDEVDLVKGIAPEEVHMYVQHFPVSDIPVLEEKLEVWCQERWMEKESYLAKFYQHKSFSDISPKAAVSKTKEKEIYLLLWAVVVFWSMFLFGILYLLIMYSLFKWYCLLSIATFVYFQTYHGGIDDFLYASEI